MWNHGAIFIFKRLCKLPQVASMWIVQCSPGCDHNLLLYFFICLYFCNLINLFCLKTFLLQICITRWHTKQFEFFFFNCGIEHFRIWCGFLLLGVHVRPPCNFILWHIYVNHIIESITYHWFAYYSHKSDILLLSPTFPANCTTTCPIMILAHVHFRSCSI